MSQLRKYLRWLPSPVYNTLKDSYFVVLDLKDRLRGQDNELTPPNRLQHYVGGGNFQEIGRKFFHHFREICDLRAHEAVLDIGCGTGRMAVALLDYLQGPYLGFDISKDAIDWCQAHISPRKPHFNFQYANIYNKAYNPKGSTQAFDYQFPCNDASIDFAFATSVFTHMPPREVKHYLAEIYRVLRPGGRALLTFFLIDETAQCLMDKRSASLTFDTPLEGCFTADAQIPEKAIAYSETKARQLLHEAGLVLQEPIFFGSWSGRQATHVFQDLVVAVKPIS